MPAVPFRASHDAVELKPAPIFADWIRAGNPRARASELSRSADGSAWTVVWDCMAGSFEWVYDCDETIHIVSGSAVLSDCGNPPTRLGPGDVVFFPKGSRVHWQVENHGRKVAFFRRSLPNPLNGVYKLLRQLRAALRGAPARNPMGLGAPAAQSAGAAAWEHPQQSAAGGAAAPGGAAHKSRVA